MTLETSLHKQRGDFSHNYEQIRIKCPECIRIVKGSNHVKAFKNLAGVWRHFKLEHGDISNLSFTTSEVMEILKNIAKAIELGMIPEANESRNIATTSLSVLYNGRPARRDVLHNLKELANMMRHQSGMYPIFRKENIFAYIKVVLGNPDYRTKKKYFDCIADYSILNNLSGSFDVTDFCEKLHLD